jgi:hypothetical protein
MPDHSTFGARSHSIPLEAIRNSQNSGRTRMTETGSGICGLGRRRDGRHVVVASAFDLVISVSILCDHRIRRTLSGRTLVVLTAGEGFSDGDDVVGVVDVLHFALDGRRHNDGPADRGDCVVRGRWWSALVVMSGGTTSRTRKLN